MVEWKKVKAKKKGKRECAEGFGIIYSGRTNNKDNE